jgi:hypothetical protein
VRTTRRSLWRTRGRRWRPGRAAGSNATGNVLTNDTDVDAGDGKTVSA